MKYNVLFFAPIIFFVFVSSSATAQIKNIKKDSPYPTKYFSSDDTHLTLKTLTVAMSYDNVGGIYKEAAERTLIDLISKDQFWAYSEFKWPASISKTEQRADAFDGNPAITLETLVSSKANGLISTITTKSPQGINVVMTLFTQDKGYPLIQLSYQDEKLFEISKFKEIITNLYLQLKQKLPYKAFITSRRANKITINAGLNAQLKLNDKLSVAQIIKINRHPKLKFMTGVEKEITGQIVLTDVQEYSSFGEIIFEKEAGVIEKNSKLLPPHFLNYQNTESIAGASTSSNDKSQPSEWVSQATPQFGKITLLGGFSDYKLSTVLNTGLPYDSGNSFAPTYELGAQLWITPNYFAQINLQQLFFKGSNSLTGSFPGTLNYTVSNMDLLFGYKYALNGNFWGPNLTGALGYLSKSTSISNSSPTAFSSFETSGLQLQAGGYFPVTEKNDAGLGIDLKYLFTTRLSESPVDSGTSNPTFSQFNFYGTYAYTSNINLKGEIIFSSINAGFSGNGSRINPAQSIEEKITSYLFGIEYLF